MKGIVEGCRQSDCLLLGGEVSICLKGSLPELLLSVEMMKFSTCFDTQRATSQSSFSAHRHKSSQSIWQYCVAAAATNACLQTAEMPGFYKEGEYDVAGFAVGSVKQDKVIDGKRIQEGDVLLGLPSSGVHSNGFSLARRVIEVASAHIAAISAQSP